MFILIGSQAAHEKAPHIKSVMITGPRGTGKKSLVHAICTETGANLFNLTPANVAGKYPGKAGLNMLLHMVFKVCVTIHVLYTCNDNGCTVHVYNNIMYMCIIFIF